MNNAAFPAKCLCTVCSGHIAFAAGNSGETYCQVCGSVGKPKKFTPGSLLLEIVLWLLIIVPGVIYSFWRLSSRRAVCSVCRSPNIIPATSPNALRAIGTTTVVLCLSTACVMGQTASDQFAARYGQKRQENSVSGVTLRPIQSRPTTPPKAEYRTITNQLFNVTLSQSFELVRGRCDSAFPGGIVVAKDRKEAVTTVHDVNPPQIAGSIGGTPLQKTAYVTVGTDYKAVLHAPDTVAGADISLKAVRIGTTNYLDRTVPLYDYGIPARR